MPTGAPYLHEELGLASRLDALQAAALSVKLRYVTRWNVARRQVAEWYRERRFVDRPRGAPGRHGSVCRRPGGEAHVFHQYVIRVPGHRDGLRAYLDDHGIGTQVYYPIPLSLQPCLRHLGYKEGDFPEAERASAETLALPMYPEMPRRAVETVVEAIGDYYRTRC